MKLETNSETKPKTETSPKNKKNGGKMVETIYKTIFNCGNAKETEMEKNTTIPENKGGNEKGNKNENIVSSFLNDLEKLRHASETKAETKAETEMETPKLAISDDLETINNSLKQSGNKLWFKVKIGNNSASLVFSRETNRVLRENGVEIDENKNYISRKQEPMNFGNILRILLENENIFANRTE